MTEEGDGTVPIVTESNNLSNARAPTYLQPEHLQQASGSSSQPSASRQQQNDRQEAELKYGAEHVIKLFIPVSLCMMVVVVTINTVNFYTKKDMYLVYTPFHETSSDTFTKTWNAVANSLILITVVIFTTLLLILLYKYKFYKVINAWLIISSLMLMFLFAYLFFEELLRAFNIPMDIVTIGLFNLNFGVLGIMVIHWKGPLRIQQGYLIFIAALMALVFIKYLPEWTTWAVLFVISVWDVVAVLTPRGPLRILVETAQERNETIFPSLIYSAVAYAVTQNTTLSEEALQHAGRADQEIENDETGQGSLDSASSFNSAVTDNESVDSPVSPPEKVTTVNEDGNISVLPAPRSYSSCDDSRTYERESSMQHAAPRYHSANAIIENVPANDSNSTTYQDMEEDRGVKLGLGDFIFYSVLVGKASSYGDWNTTIACFIAILVGLSLTLLLLATYRRALPALPISIAFGLVFYFVTRGIVKPFSDMLTSNQVFI